MRAIRDAGRGDRSHACPSSTCVRCATRSMRRLHRSDLAAGVVGGFAIAALLLAMIGIYGVIAYAVRDRQRELGIRIALGASAWRIVGLVVSDGLMLVGVGLVVGLGGSVTRQPRAARAAVRHRGDGCRDVRRQRCAALWRSRSWRRGFRRRAAAEGGSAHCDEAGVEAELSDIRVGQAGVGWLGTVWLCDGRSEVGHRRTEVGLGVNWFRGEWNGAVGESACATSSSSLTKCVDG